MKRLKKLEEVAQPVVAAVHLRTLLNGWVMSRRMASLEGNDLVGECPFCNRAQDSLEHFAYCPIIKEAFAKHGHHIKGAEDFLGLNPHSYPDGILKIARLLAALYTARNAIVHHGAESPKEILKHACQLVS